MNERQSGGTVSSAEITRNFGYWQEQAARCPLTITHHGRPRYILSTMDAWNEAGARRTIGEGPPHSGRDLEYDFLVEHMAGGLIVVDEDLRICEASTAAALLIGRTTGDLVGMPIEQLVIPLGSGHVAASLAEVLQTGCETQFDLPVATTSRARIRARAFHWPRGVALLLHCYHETSSDGDFAEHLALEKARAAHGVVAAVRLSVRATIAKAEAGFIRLVGLSSDRVTGARFVDLLTLPARAAAREVIEKVLGGKSDAEAFESRLLGNAGAEIPVRISIAAMADGYAVSGAMMMVTEHRAAMPG